jgi:hypothetical protein
MGMFDYFHSSYDLGEGFTNVLCQTKEIDPSGLGGTMSNYWLSPAGCLYVATYRETHNFEEIKEGDPDYKEKKQFLNYRWVPTGAHGKVEPFFITAYVEIYPAEWAGDWEDWPRMKLHFKSGKLVEYRRCERGEAF